MLKTPSRTTTLRKARRICRKFIRRMRAAGGHDSANNMLRAMHRMGR